MDNLTPERRSALMAKIRGDNLGPETRLAAQFAPGEVSSRNAAHLPGKPDLVLYGAFRPLAVFVHGCFWHGCPEHYRQPKTRAAHWAAHIGKNKRRDEKVRRALRRLGYRTAVVWEHDLKTEEAAAALAARLRKKTICTH